MGTEGVITQSSSASSEQYVPTEEVSEQRSAKGWKQVWAEVKHTFTTRDGLIGDYDYAYLFTPNIWPLNKRYHQQNVLRNSTKTLG